MARRPLIGLTGGRIQGSDITSSLPVLDTSDVDIYFADYSRALLAAGAIPVWLPHDLDPADVVDWIDGLLLTGGFDVAPQHYSAMPAPETVPAPARRDELELELLDLAAARSLPTLGICRGLQLLNVYAGGTLQQHVPTHAYLDEAGHVEQHVVMIEPDSVLGALYGETKAVNSLHHQSVDLVGSSLRVTARSADDGVEGIEHRDRPIVAVQWHPEMLATATTDPIFTWLVESST